MEGINAISGQDYLHAETAKEFEDAIEMLLKHPERAQDVYKRQVRGRMPRLRGGTGAGQEPAQQTAGYLSGPRWDDQPPRRILAGY